MSIKLGIKGRAETIVVPENIASALNPVLAPVFATPYLVALMENSAIDAISRSLPEGEGSVGTYINVSHDSATPIGMKVWAESKLVALDGKALTFSITAFDDYGVVGKGTHGRYIINEERFLAKVKKKSNA